MPATNSSKNYSLAELFIRERFVMTIILINTLVLFFDEFPMIHKQTQGILRWIDYGCILFFVLEVILKVRAYGFHDYWANGWNKFDFFVTVASIPTLLMPFVPMMDNAGFMIFPLFRVGRLFRFFRLLRFIPNIHHITVGIRRALRASIGIFLALLLLNLALAIGATMLFSDFAPKYFGDPLSSSYSLFKVFTIEGWYEIPDELAESGKSAIMISFLRGYFIVSVLVGGLLGFSLANAVFVDEMTADNTDDLEDMVRQMHHEVEEMYERSQKNQQTNWNAVQAELKEMRAMIEEMRKNSRQ